MANQYIAELSNFQAEMERLTNINNNIELKIEKITKTIEEKRKERNEYIQSKLSKMRFNWTINLVIIIIPILLISFLISDFKKLGTDSITNGTLISMSGTMCTFEFKSTFWSSKQTIAGIVEDNKFYRATGGYEFQYGKIGLTFSGCFFILLWILAWSVAIGFAYRLSLLKKSWLSLLNGYGTYTPFAQITDDLSFKAIKTSLEELEDELSDLESDNDETTDKISQKLKEINSVLDDRRNEIVSSILKQIDITDFDGAMKALELLVRVKPTDIDFVNLRDKVKNASVYLCDSTPLICDNTNGAFDERKVISIAGIDGKTEIINRGLIYGLWFYAVTVPFDKYSYKALMTPCLKLKQNGHMNINIAATLMYISSKYGYETVKHLMPDYAYKIEELRANAKEGTLRCLASVANWCGEEEYESQLMRQIGLMGE